MAHRIGIAVAINGSVTDNTVISDLDPWSGKIGNLVIREGGGSWWRQGSPATCTFDANLPAQYANKVRTITVAVTFTDTITNLSTCAPLAQAADFDVATEYQIVFHGDVVSIKGSTAGFIQFTAASELSGFLNAKARSAAFANSGVRDALDDLYGATAPGRTQFPLAAWANYDRPVQKENKNGEWAKIALAGTGANLTADWRGYAIEAAGLTYSFRPDFFNAYWSTDTTYQHTWNVGYPWLLSYTDVGIVYEDFVARVNVYGESAGGAQHYGWSRMSTTANRQSVGNRDITLNTWKDTAAECQVTASTLLTFQALPTYVKMNEVEVSLEAMFHAYDTMGAAVSDTQNTHALASLMLGDLVEGRTQWDFFDNTNTSYGDWPTHAPQNGDLYDTLYELWHPTQEGNTGSGLVDGHIVRSITRTWSAAGGWVFKLGFDPYPTDTIGGPTFADSGSATY